MASGLLSTLEDLHCPTTGRRLRLRRAWPRAGDHLLLEYLDTGEGDQGGATVAGQWFADRRRLQEVAGQTAARAGTGMVSTLDHAGVVLQRNGADRRLGALAGALVDPGSTLVVHRPERRAVVRRARPGVTTYLKVLRAGRLPPALEACRGVRSPPVIRRDRDTGTIEYGELPGASLHHLMGDPLVADGDVADALRATGTCLRRLHATAPPAGVGVHTPADEARVARRWVDHALALCGLGPDLGGAALAGLASVTAALVGDAAPARMSLLHRDLHDKQVLVEGDGSVGVLDLDTLAVGDPAVDVANLLAHLELRALQGHCPPHRSRTAGAAFLAGYRPGAALEGRLPVYLAATRLRLACVYAFRPRWRSLAGRLLAAG